MNKVARRAGGPVQHEHERAARRVLVLARTPEVEQAVALALLVDAWVRRFAPAVLTREKKL